MEAEKAKTGDLIFFPAVIKSSPIVPPTGHRVLVISIGYLLLTLGWT